MVDPGNGTGRVFMWWSTEVQKCPDCTRACNVASPTEAFGCSPATPGCPEGLCCVHVGYTEWYICKQGTAP